MINTVLPACKHKEMLSGAKSIEGQQTFGYNVASGNDHFGLLGRLVPGSAFEDRAAIARRRVGGSYQTGRGQLSRCRERLGGAACVQGPDTGSALAAH